MSDESTEVAEGTEQKTEPTVLKNFGNLDEVFDRVFPATAEKKEAEPVPEPAAAVPEAKPAPPAEVKPPSAVAEELPDFLTGEKPKEEPKPVESEFELPPPKGKESANMTMFREKFDLVKSKARAREQELLGQLAELKKAPAAAPDADATIKSLEAQVQELSGAIERTSIENHPRFRAEFTEPRARKVAAAHEILKDARADPDQWDRAISLKGAARTDALEELYDNLPRAVSSELGALAVSIRDIDARQDAVLADRKGLHERLQQEQLRQQHEALKQHEINTLEILQAAEKDLIDRMGMEVYKTSDSPDHKKWNESVERMKADARKILLETTDPSVMARAALLAPAAIQYRYLYHIMRDRWIEERDKNKAIEKADPGAKTRGETSTNGDDKLTFAESVARQVFGR